MTSGSPAAAFSARARHEAERYGGNAWIFVRELVQNARDAGASEIRLTTFADGDREGVCCRDDGCGMSFALARRYLFTLYASNKRSNARLAGRFGVGFWSVLRFEPERITIRSRPAGGAGGWRLVLDSRLEILEHTVDEELARGTEVVLERRASGTDLDARLRATARAEARFLCRRDEPHAVLPLTVNGEPVNADFDLPAPSARFSRPGLRGVVALGPQPEVELFSHGLRVRAATTLNELAGRTAPVAAGRMLPDGLWPQVLLDSDQLQLLLNRGDARADRALHRALDLARRELDHLLRRQLDLVAPASWTSCLGAWVRRTLRERRPLWGALALAVAGLLGWAALQGTPRGRSGFEQRPLAPGIAAPSGAARGAAEGIGSYRRPGVSAVASPALGWPLVYSPRDAVPYFALMRFVGLAEDGSVVRAPPPLAHEIFAESAQADLMIELQLDGAEGELRLPVPSGQALVRGSLELAGQSALEPLPGEGGVPVLLLDAPVSGTLRYRTAPAPVAAAAGASWWPPLPPELAQLANTLRALPGPQRARAAADAVARLVVYDRSPAVVAAYRERREDGGSLLARAVAIGAGDCDVQAALTAAVLARVGVRSRVAVGAVGRDGRVSGLLHAWLEVGDEGGRWRVVEPTAAAVALAPRSSGSTAGTAPGSREARRSMGWWILVPAALVLLLPAWFVRRWRRRVRRQLSLSGEDQRLAMVRGALSETEAYGAASSLLRRALVPVHHGPAGSLHELQARARKGRLFVAEDGGELLQRALAGRRTVIDGGSELGREVAHLLGACDLDGWRQQLAGCRRSTLTDSLEMALAAAGAHWRIRTTPQAEGGVEVLDLGSLRVALVAQECLRQAVGDENERRPSAVVRWRLGELVVPQLPLSRGAVTRVLAELAQGALSEAAADAEASP